MKRVIKVTQRQIDDVIETTLIKKKQKNVMVKYFYIKIMKKIVGLIIGIINNDATIRYDFKAPKRGRITELVVDKEYRGKGIGKELLLKMKEHLKSNGCEKIMIAVFGYNESAIKFYKENGFHIRMLDMIED